MRIRPSLLAAALVLTAGTRADEGHQHSGAPPEKLGTVHFATSCTPAAQKEFTRAVALLHSFWYSEAAKGFRRTADADPACGMASWGLAMTDFHPIWAPPNPTELARGAAAAAKAKEVGAKTERERDYIDAIGVFYGGADRLDHRTRALAYEQAMERVQAKHPGDHEAAIFHALALDGLQLPTDKTYTYYKRAADILTKILPEEPDHPGVAHYIIHSYDVPALASLGLPAARSYAKIAPSSPHALHMPSHIFTRLGLWDDSISSNIASAKAGREAAERAKPGTSSFDQLHALDYMEYAYLQKGDDANARKVLEEARSVTALDDPQFAAAYALAAVPSRFALERRSWADAASLSVAPSWFPWSKYRWAEALLHHARALGAARSGDIAAAKQALASLAEIQQALAGAKETYWAGQVEIERLEADGWIARAEGRDADALARLTAAADLEDATEKHPVTPGAVLPAREQLGDLLVELKRPADALAAYEASNAKSPNRLNGLLGAATAARLNGDEAKARELGARLLELTGTRAPERKGLDAARSLAKTGG
jgi:hypothetical protein